ncbi:MAG: PspA-associated protein PspAA [Acidimicrobiales bacterium]
MIIRILAEGRYDVPDGALPAIEQLDAELVDALDRADDAAFTAALADLIGEVRHSGKRLPDDDVGTSALVVPHEGSTLVEVEALLAEEL